MQPKVFVSAAHNICFPFDKCTRKCFPSCLNVVMTSLMFDPLLGIAKGIAHLHNLRNPILHGDFKVSDVLIPAKTLEPKIANFGLWDFKKFFIENTLPGQNSTMSHLLL